MTKLQMVKAMNPVARAWAETAMAFAMTPNDKLPSYFPRPGGGLWWSNHDMAKNCAMETLKFAQSRATHFLYRVRQSQNDEMIQAVADNPSHAGQDLFLTPGGHGSGFWDGDWEHGEELTIIAKEFCEMNSEFRDGLVRVMPG